jgi:trk system potassium uptake protein TrkH
MFIGGCAGSTAGGPKAVRILLLLKHARWELFKYVHPNAVKPIKFNQRTVSENMIQEIVSFIVIYFLIFMASVFVICLLGVDILTSITASITTLGNIGPGFNIIGPMASFNSMPAMAKIILIINMWIGRLEVFTVVVLFTPEFWKK